MDFVAQNWGKFSVLLGTGWGTFLSVVIGAAIIGYSIVNGLKHGGNVEKPPEALQLPIASTPEIIARAHVVKEAKPIPKPTAQPIKKVVDLSVLFAINEEQTGIWLLYLPYKDRDESRNAQAVLLILYGYLKLMGVDEPKVSSVNWSLSKSECKRSYASDPFNLRSTLSLIDPLDAVECAQEYDEVYIQRVGLKRGGCLKLTASGLTKAEALAAHLIERK